MYSRRETSLRNRRALCLAGLALAVALPAGVLAQSDNLSVAPEAPAAPPSHLVRELLEHDAKQALAIERSKNKTALASSSLAAPPAIGITPADPEQATAASASPSKQRLARLIAIVGVGGHLAAHLQLDNRQAVYVTGKAAPATGAGQGMRLLEISPPCATFLSQEEETFTYCLDERAP
ncbi:MULTISPECIES: hypothetical protein [Achromobacter]|uniref:Pilus assembly protein PilP n=1 Tax=Achromobacter spanius TaxID=217203 RepID=A0AAW3I2S7_9BURK|nr:MULTISPECIES: hypothetical protein [Achromobacter]KNE27073.1 hypothetical protein AFM18_14475 [Achromobacter spanius]